MFCRERNTIGVSIRRGKSDLTSCCARVRLPVLDSGCATSPSSEDAAAATEGITDVADLFVVDCLLPGQVRTVGGRTYLTPRRPTRTTTVDCRTRGGEYVAYDRADLTSALRVWMTKAEGRRRGSAEYGRRNFRARLGRRAELRGCGDLV